MVGVINFEGEIWVGECFKVEDEFFDYFAFGFDIVVVAACVFEVEFEVATSWLGVGDCVLRVGDEDE